MRKGFLPIATTRGDRLFIGLLIAAYINLAFIGLAGKFTEWFSLEQEPSIWVSFVVSMARAGAGHEEGLRFQARRDPARSFPGAVVTSLHTGKRTIEETTMKLRYTALALAATCAVTGPAPGPARPRPRSGSTASSSRRRCPRTSRWPR